MNIVKRLKELYDNNPVEIDFLYDLGRYHEKLESEPLENLTAEELEKYRYEDEIADIMSNLSPRLIMKEFGEEMLHWLGSNLYYGEITDILFRKTANMTGKDKEMLTRAQSGVCDVVQEEEKLPGRTKLIMETYDFLEKLNNGLLENIDLPSLLRKNKAEGIDRISDKRIKDYSLAILNTTEGKGFGWDKEWFGKPIKSKNKISDYFIYLDTPAGIGLLHKGMPNAVVGFTPYNGDTLMIYQIQGVRPKVRYKDSKEKVRGSARGLCCLNWESLLVDIVERTAKETGYGNIGIMCYANNRYFHNKTREERKRGKRRYDLTAKNLGFERKKDRNWYKPL